MLDIQKLVLGERFFKKLKLSQQYQNSQVNKKGPNTGREFWCCARGEGRYFILTKNLFFVETTLFLPPERGIRWPGVTSSNGSSRENVIS